MHVATHMLTTPDGPSHPEERGGLRSPHTRFILHRVRGRRGQKGTDATTLALPFDIAKSTHGTPSAQAGSPF